MKSGEKEGNREKATGRVLPRAGGLVHKWCGSRRLQQGLSPTRSLGKKIVIASITDDR